MKPHSLIAVHYFLIIVLTSCSNHKSNYVTIQNSDSKKDIIRKAANVVPTLRQLRWQQLELTIFFHFGINTFTDNEWGSGKEDPAVFNPENLDADQWIETIRNAGFKQIVLTAKHHDGFCLWPTKTTSYSVAASPWENGSGDVVKEVAEACKRHNIGFGFYLSPWDRNATSYGSESYNDFFLAQLTELLTWYGQVDEVWLDGACGEGPDGKKQVYDYFNWYQRIRELQPEAVIAVTGPDVRWVGTETGKGRATEWSVLPSDYFEMASSCGENTEEMLFRPLRDLKEHLLGSRAQIENANGLVWYPAETDVSIRPGWFYHSSEDTLVKSPRELMQIYLTSAGMNSVLLLNVPPDKNGLIHRQDSVNLMIFKQMRDKTFSDNLLAGAEFYSPEGKNEPALTDNNLFTHFTTKGKVTTTTIEMTLPGEIIFNLLALQENISVGQRVELFRFEYLNQNNQWIEILSGTTIGYKRLIKFSDITAQKTRLSITGSRMNPAIAEIGLYLMTE